MSRAIGCSPKQIIGVIGMLSRFEKLVTLVAAVVLLCMLAGPAAAGEPQKVRFGALPVLQALPLYVAQEKGLFSKAGVDVDLVPFNTAAEKDIALASGNIDGCFADLVTPSVLIGNGRDVRIVATNYDTRSDRRMFAVLGRPAGKYRNPGDLAGVPIAVSSNSVIHYVTERLLTAGGVAEDKVASVEAKNIGMRMQMLISGQVEAATLPEPLVTAAVNLGATLVADDSGIGESQTVLVFSGQFLKQHADVVKAFLRAVADASRLVNEQPDSVRPVMVEHVRLPEGLRATYPVPHFPDLRAPDKECVTTVAQWLKKRGVITPMLTYEQVVDASYIP